MSVRCHFETSASGTVCLPVLAHQNERCRSSRSTPTVLGTKPTPRSKRPPNSEIVEDRLAAYEGAESCILFSSGMSAIATTILTFTKYGGTETLVSRTLMAYDVEAVGFADGVDETIHRPLAQGDINFCSSNRASRALDTCCTAGTGDPALIEIIRPARRKP
jgi:cystathionine beta-lyase/cystathionine gamma-synthase